MAPKNNPPIFPKTGIDSKISILGITAIINGFIKITNIVLTPNDFPNTKNESNNNGIEMHKVIVETEIPVTVDKMIAIPVIPPGAKPVKIKIQFTANAQRILETDNQIKSYKNDFNDCLD